jgi:hypothetical protein
LLSTAKLRPSAAEQTEQKKKSECGEANHRIGSGRLGLFGSLPPPIRSNITSRLRMTGDP